MEYAVYIIKSGNHCKIGYSNNIEGRIKDIQVGNPNAIHKIHSIPLPSLPLARNCEESLHKLFANKRYNGEWFALAKVDLDFVCTIAGYYDGVFIYDTAHIDLPSILMQAKDYKGDEIIITTNDFREFLSKSWQRQMNGTHAFSSRYWTKHARPRLKETKYKTLISVLDDCNLIINRRERYSGELACPPQDALKVLAVRFAISS